MVKAEAQTEILNAVQTLQGSVTELQGAFVDLQKSTDARFTELYDVVTFTRDNFSERLDGIDTRLDHIEEDIRRELDLINRRLDVLEERTKDMGGYAKEIDKLREWVKRLERQVIEQSSVKVYSMYRVKRY